MAACEVCGDVDTTACRYCDRPVCRNHRRPAQHACTGPSTAPAFTQRGIDADRGRDPVKTGVVLVFGTLVVTIAVILATSFGPVAGTPPVAGPNETQVATAVQHLVNDERTTRGLHPLSVDPVLERVARDHSARMARSDTFGHGDEPLSKRYARYGLDCPGAENIYAVTTVGGPYDEQALARRTVEAWLASPGHRTNLLGERFTRQGVGVATSIRRGRTTVYVTQDLC